MTLRWTVLFVVLLSATDLMAQQRGGGPPQLKTLREQASYSFGMSMGSTLKKQGIEIDVPLMVQGIRDATDGKTLLTEEQAAQAMQAFEKEMIARQAELSKKFLAENGQQPGVKTTKSGLQYKVIKVGEGPRPKASDVVHVNYKASFTNGEQFESNGEKPFTTAVNGVIPGWQEALQMMPVGSKMQLFVPPDLAYGEQGSPPVIGPNTTLVFELELVDIAKPAEGAARKSPLRTTK